MNTNILIIDAHIIAFKNDIDRSEIDDYQLYS